MDGKPDKIPPSGKLTWLAGKMEDFRYHVSLLECIFHRMKVDFASWLLTTFFSDSCSKGALPKPRKNQQQQFFLQKGGGCQGSGDQGEESSEGRRRGGSCSWSCRGSAATESCKKGKKVGREKSRKKGEEEEEDLGRDYCRKEASPSTGSQRGTCFFIFVHSTYLKSWTTVFWEKPIARCER